MLLAGTAPAHADPALDVIPHAGLGVAYVDNPFYDPLDPGALQLVSTSGDSAQFDLGAGVRATWQAGASGRLEGTASGNWSTWRGAAIASGWGLGLGLSWAQDLTDALEGRIDLSAAGSAIDAFPDDDLWWGELRVGARYALGVHRLEASLGAGLRDVPRRLVDPDSETRGQQDALLRGRLAARLRPGAGLTLSPTYTVDITRTRIGGRDHDTHALTAAVDRVVLDFDTGATLSAWARDFAPPDAATAARLDLGFALDLRVGRTLWDGVDLSARYRYLRSTSDDPFGAYAQHFAGVELFVWYVAGPDAARVQPDPQSGQPVSTGRGWVFRHRDPAAARVALVGDFNDWSAEHDPMTGPDAEGWWTVTIPLAAGRHGYMFVVDGERFVRPEDAPRYADDGFGGEVGVLFVLPASGSQAGR